MRGKSASRKDIRSRNRAARTLVRNGAYSLVKARFWSASSSSAVDQGVTLRWLALGIDDARKRRGSTRRSGTNMQIKDVRPESFTKQIRCDRCGHLAELGEVEFHEMASLDLKAGYGSIFGDGNDVQIDLCQHCLKLSAVAR